jgi:hypothetical protein
MRVREKEGLTPNPPRYTVTVKTNRSQDLSSLRTHHFPPTILDMTKQTADAYKSPLLRSTAPQTQKSVSASPSTKKAQSKTVITNPIPEMRSRPQTPSSRETRTSFVASEMRSQFFPSAPTESPSTKKPLEKKDQQAINNISSIVQETLEQRKQHQERNQAISNLTVINFKFFQSS